MVVYDISDRIIPTTTDVVQSSRRRTCRLYTAERRCVWYNTKRYVRACAWMRARACVAGSGGYRLRQIIGISLTGRILLVRGGGGGGGGRRREWARERFRPPADPTTFPRRRRRLLQLPLQQNIPFRLELPGTAPVVRRVRRRPARPRSSRAHSAHRRCPAHD